jgi:hypothetical protein
VGHELDVVIAGGSAAGLFAGLLLARAGHQVLLLERDRLEPAPDVESAAAAAFRPAAPQIVQPHIVMARCRQLLIEHLPDVYAGLLAAGVAEAPLRTQMPDSLLDTAAWPGDERLTLMMTRRSTVDWVLRRIAAAEPRITVRCGVKVTGLLAAPSRPGTRPPHVIGVRTDRGMAYFSRHYRVRPGADLPAPLVTRTVVALDEFLAGKWGGDNGAVQLVVAPLAADHRFRTAREPQVFTAVLRTIPACAAWLDVMDPITGVYAAHHLRRATAPAVPDSRPGHLFAAARGRVPGPDRLPRALEDQRDGLPTRAGLHRSRRNSVHAGNAQAAQYRAAGRPASPRAAPHRPHPVEAFMPARPPGRTVRRFLWATRSTGH